MVKLIFKGNSIGKALTNITAYLLLAQCIAEFLKIQWIHAQMTLLRGDDKVLDTLPCFGIHLHLVKDDKRLTLVQLHAIICGQQHEERVKIVHVLHEIVLHFIGALGEVDEDVALIFVFAELLTNR